MMSIRLWLLQPAAGWGVSQPPYDVHCLLQLKVKLLSLLFFLMFEEFNFSVIHIRGMDTVTLNGASSYKAICQ